jgi:hypothetical protein
MKIRRESASRLAALVVIAAGVVVGSMWVFQLSETNSLPWWGSFIIACITLVVIWTHKWFPKPSSVKPPSLPEMSTPQALDRIYNEMVNQYSANQQRFGRGILLAVLLSSIGLAVAGLAQVLEPLKAGSLFILIGVIEITVLWIAWTIADWDLSRH